MSDMKEPRLRGQSYLFQQVEFSIEPNSRERS
jgi:hypothetical protein